MEAKKIAPSVTPLEAKAENGTTISNILSDSTDVVNDEFRQEIEALYSQLSSEGKDRVFKFVKLYHFDPEFALAFDTRFGDGERCDYPEVQQFIDTWEAGAA